MENKPKPKKAARARKTKMEPTTETTAQVGGKLTYKSTHPRNVLGEGRNYGLGFGFAHRVGDVLKSISPISPCKDYLNDVVYVEKTGKPYSAYGYVGKEVYWAFREKAYLMMQVCLMGANCPVTYGDYSNDVAKLANNHPFMQKVVNWFEEKFGVDGRTEIVKVEDNLYVAIAPTFWTEATYLISLYSLILRCAMEKSEGEPMAVLTNNPPAGDYSSAKGAVPKVELMLAGTIPKQDMSKDFFVHSCGILGFTFPQPATATTPAIAL